MCLLALPIVAHRNFALFYRSHLFFVVFIFVGTVFHGIGASVSHGHMPVALPGLAFWLVDVVIRTWALNCAACWSLACWCWLFDARPRWQQVCRGLLSGSTWLHVHRATCLAWHALL
jgi:hypothetical protein